MQDTALDRALIRLSPESPPIDWKVIQRIVGRQYALPTLQTSLERIVEEHSLPKHVFYFVLQKMLDASIDGAAQCVYRAIRHIWRRVLVDRSAIAFHIGMAERRMGQQLVTRAHVDYENELLAIQSKDDLDNNQCISRAFQKTKYMLKALQKRGDLPRRIPLVHALIEAKLPSFLIYLAAREDPRAITEATCPQGRLALHAAMEAEILLQRGLPDEQRIQFSPPSQNLHDSVSQRWLNLLQRQSPVYLLCHLCPEAAAVGTDWNRHAAYNDSYIPLETFLYSLKSLPRLPQGNRLIARNGYFGGVGCDPISRYNLEPILQDVRRVLKICPQALETRHPNSRMWPFVVPMVSWNIFQEEKEHSRIRQQPQQDPPKSSVAQNFLLTLTYTLLRENPMVLSRSYDTDNVKIPPCTAYERVLEERLEQAVEKLATLQQYQDSLKRRIEQVQQANEAVLTAAAAAAGSPSKRHKPRRIKKK